MVTLAAQMSAHRIAISRGVLLAAVIVVALYLPRVLSEFWLVIAILALYQAYLATSWNVVAGFAGQLSLGNAIFVAVGGYTSTLIFIHLDITPWMGMFGGVALATAAGASIGIAFFRWQLSGMSFALGTFALSQIAFWYIIGSDDLNARDGYRLPLSFESADYQFRQRAEYYYVMLALLAGLILFTWRLRRGRVGYYLIAIREDQTAAEALGVNLVKYKTIALSISAGLTALGGTFLAQFLLIVGPELFLKPQALLPPIVVTVFGGLGTVLGPAIGALILVPLAQYLRSELADEVPGIDLIMYGAVLMLVMVFMPRGIQSGLLDAGHRLRRLWTSFSVRIRHTAADAEAPPREAPKSPREPLDSTVTDD